MMLYNDEDEFTMIWQPDLNQDKDFQIVGFPFIKQLVDKEGRYNAVVTATIVSEPVLKGSEGNEYCQTDIDVSIDACEKIEYVELGAVGIPKTYRNSVRTKGCTNILNKAGYSKRQSDILRERNLIMSGNKWQAVKKYQVDLSTLTDSTAEKIKNCEQWVMKINKKTRDATVLEQKQDGIVNEIKTTVIITISDPMHRGMAYNEGIRLLNNNNFVHTNVMVRNEVHIEGNAD